MIVLALELSTARGSVVVVDDERAQFAAEFANDRKHSGAFFENLAAARERCPAPDRIIVGLGPGSYAGVRIAISAAIGLQLATGAELIGLASICAVNIDAEAFCVVGDARRGAFWFALVRSAICEQGPVVLDRSEFHERLQHADLPMFSAESLSDFPAVQTMYPSAGRLAQLARGDHPGKVQPPLQPIYLREPHITVSKQPVWKTLA